MKNIKLAAYTYNVFNAEQIEGIPPQEAAISPCDIATLKAQRDAFLHNLGVGFREGGDRAYYSSGTDVITMPRAQYFNNDYGYMATLLHEAGHATVHSSRLNRPLGNEFASPEYAKEELRAEIASAFVAQTLHLPYQETDMAEELEQHKAYVQSWIDSLENDPNELFAAIKVADKIADYLMERGQLQELTQVSTSPRLVGRIDFLSYNGEVGESQEYSDASKFIEAIKEENFYGVPMTIIIYKDLEGKHISTSFVQKLDPLPQGLRFEQCPNEAENAEPPSREFQPTNDFELEL